MSNKQSAAVAEFRNMIELINSQTADFNYGGGACSWFAIGKSLLFACQNEYEKNKTELGPVTKFINDGPLKHFLEQYLIISKKSDGNNKLECKRPDWADPEKYPVQALEYNKHFDQRFYGAFYKFFETDTNFDNEKKTFGSELVDILEDLFYDPDDTKNKKDEMKKERELYKKMYNGVVSYQENQIKINLDYEILQDKIKKLEDKDEFKFDSENSLKMANRFYKLFGLCVNNKDKDIKIDYNFDFRDWIYIDGENKKLNTNFFDKATEWDKYYFSNMLGQAFREYLLKLSKDYKDGNDKTDFAKKASKLAPSFLVNKIDSLSEVLGNISKPYLGQSSGDIDFENNLIAEKTGKPCIMFSDDITADGYLLYVTDSESKKTEKYHIVFENNCFSVYRTYSLVFNCLVDKQQIRNLIDKIKTLAENDPLCYSIIDQMGLRHATAIANKKKEFIQNMVKFLECYERHAPSKFFGKLTNVKNVGRDILLLPLILCFGPAFIMLKHLFKKINQLFTKCTRRFLNLKRNKLRLLKNGIVMQKEFIKKTRDSQSKQNVPKFSSLEIKNENNMAIGG